MTLHPDLAEAAWPYDETDDGNFDPHALIVFAEDAQKIIDAAVSRAWREGWAAGTAEAPTVRPDA